MKMRVSKCHKNHVTSFMDDPSREVKWPQNPATYFLKRESIILWRKCIGLSMKRARGILEWKICVTSFMNVHFNQQTNVLGGRGFGCQSRVWSRSQEPFRHLHSQCLVDHHFRNQIRLQVICSNGNLKKTSNSWGFFW